MAEKGRKRQSNVPGPWYVDDTCIACGACADTAPKHFKLEPDGLAFVAVQPSGAAEEELCQTALESCPVEAIGNDG